MLLRIISVLQKHSRSVETFDTKSWTAEGRLGRQYRLVLKAQTPDFERLQAEGQLSRLLPRNPWAS